MNVKKPILIQGAMEVEIKNLKEELEDVKKEIIDGYEFYIGKLDGYPVIISKTEVGIMNVSVSTVLGIKTFRPCMIINQGTAGGYGNKIHKGNIVIGLDCYNINSYQTSYLEKGEGSNPLMWKMQTFYDGMDILEKLEADKELIELIKKHGNKLSDKEIVYGTIGSGDVWNREWDRIEQLNEEYGILCEDMETIGAYTIAKRYQVPIIGIRVIADNEMLKEEYDKDLASKSQEYVIDLCKKWIKEGK